jgi:catechol-2,3-dioxygenase
MKKFYTGILGLHLVEEEKDKFIFLQAGKSMLLVFNPSKTMISNKELPAHGKISPPSSIH